MTSGRTASVWERRAWAAGIVFVVALLAEAVISAGLPINQDDSAHKIARQLQDHRHIVLVAAYLSAVYAVAFVIYLAKLHDLLRRVSPPPGTLHSLVLIGGVLRVALHGVSDIGIYGLLGGKIATYAAHHDQGLSYTLYLLTFALDSVGDVIGSVFLIATGLLLIRIRVLPGLDPSGRGTCSSPMAGLEQTAIAAARTTLLVSAPRRSLAVELQMPAAT